MKKKLGIALMIFPFAAFWTFVLLDGGWQIALGILVFAAGVGIFCLGAKLWEGG